MDVHARGVQRLRVLAAGFDPAPERGAVERVPRQRDRQQHQVDGRAGVEQRAEERDVDGRDADDRYRGRDGGREHRNPHLRERRERVDADGVLRAVDDRREERREAEGDEPHREAGDNLVGPELDADDGEQPRQQRARDDAAEQTVPDAARDVGRPDAGERGDDEQAFEADVDDAALLREDAAQRGERDGDREPQRRGERGVGREHGEQAARVRLRREEAGGDEADGGQQDDADDGLLEAAATDEQPVVGAEDGATSGPDDRGFVTHRSHLRYRRR